MTTNMQSLHSTEESLPGFISPGTVDADMNFLPANYTQAAGAVRTVQWFKITLPASDGTVALTAWFQGWISETLRRGSG